MTESALIQLVVQGGFAALFVWLLFDTRRDSRAREARLTAMLEKYSENFPVMVRALEHIPDIELALDRIEGRLKEGDKF